MRALWLAALGLCPGSTGMAADPGGPCALRVDIAGVRSAQGQLRVALFDRSEHYLRRAFRSAVVDAADASDGQASLCFDGLDAGDYAAAAYHDLNGNRRNDPNLFGIPAEPAAFSNGATASFGPPSWERARQRIDPPGAMRLELR